MEKTKGLYVGEVVIVTQVEEANAFEAIVVGLAATGASAQVVELSKCQQLLEKHGPGYIAEAKKQEGLVQRVKAEDLHATSGDTKQHLAKFKELAKKMSDLKVEMRNLVKELTAADKKRTEKGAEKGADKPKPKKDAK